jgi:hypothetical protein
MGGLNKGTTEREAASRDLDAFHELAAPRGGAGHSHEAFLTVFGPNIFLP